MVSDRDKVYLQHILDEIENIKLFLSDVDEELFTDSSVSETNYAVVRGLEIIGEAAARVSRELKIAHPEIKWNSIIGMRNKIIHEYLDVDYQVVWDTTHLDLPELKKAIKKLLS